MTSLYKYIYIYIYIYNSTYTLKTVTAETNLVFTSIIPVSSYIYARLSHKLQNQENLPGVVKAKNYNKEKIN